ncbi:uncharacterized protein MELLADRAFT_96351 [Melampsora larici-populina 98AG31]|uniref:Uncharacterized protein n=1 Tax=Melampsora larici-populina (strain 98AG31 / pathotype 3-4-7) TaxID=747676 RepID=F4REG4_MELLP|nr:uncharacterized protein MELLADRAFT_96351 [Melampsora larici-populina 98AG31]EGG09086.1 hypothetical protein MELLADRAFT_96351 [Melampsora larici-populina 98AG31]
MSCTGKTETVISQHLNTGMQSNEDLPLTMDGIVEIRTPSMQPSVHTRGGTTDYHYEVNAVHPFISDCHSPFNLSSTRIAPLDTGVTIAFSGTVFVSQYQANLIVNVNSGVLAPVPMPSEAFPYSPNLINVSGRGRITQRHPIRLDQNTNQWWLLILTHTAFISSLDRFVKFEIHYVDNQEHIAQMRGLHCEPGATVSLEGILITYAQDARVWIAMVKRKPSHAPILDADTALNYRLRISSCKTEDTTAFFPFSKY